MTRNDTSRREAPRRQGLLGNESGSVLILVALTLLVLLGFFALGVEAGRWYLIRAEISKSVDAGALAGAKNISNPHVDPRTVAEDFSAANFPTGYMSTPGTGPGKASFVATMDGDGKVKVDGKTNSLSVLAQLFGKDQVTIGTLGAAQMKNVELMMVLDRSGSMAGRPMQDLKVAAKSFIDYFQDTQATDRLGLVSFATSSVVDRPMGSNFVTPMKNSIDAMNASGATNPADALAKAGGPSGFTDQTGLPPERRKAQFLVFFSDGRPTAFRGLFLKSGNTYDAVACVTGNCEAGDGGTTYTNMGNPNQETWLGIDPTRTGDGKAVASACGNNNSTRWYAFDTEPVPGYAPTACNIPVSTKLHDQVCNLASGHALVQATVLKNRGVVIYSIGLGTTNSAFLTALATGPDQVYIAPSSDQLRSIFQKIAKEIKLRMVQ